MNNLRAAAQEALEALEKLVVGSEYEEAVEAERAMDALRAALAEPQTWVCPDSAEHRYQKPGHCEDCGKTLVQVAEPVPDSKHATIAEWWADKQRSPLTEEEIYSLFRTVASPVMFARAIERAHGIT